MEEIEADAQELRGQPGAGPAGGGKEEAMVTPRELK